MIGQTHYSVETWLNQMRSWHIEIIFLSNDQTCVRCLSSNWSCSDGRISILHLCILVLLWLNDEMDDSIISNPFYTETRHQIDREQIPHLCSILQSDWLPRYGLSWIDLANAIKFNGNVSLYILNNIDICLSFLWRSLICCFNVQIFQHFNIYILCWFWGVLYFLVFI